MATLDNNPQLAEESKQSEPDTDTVSFKLIVLTPFFTNETEWNAPDSTTILQAKQSVLEDLNEFDSDEQFHLSSLHLIWKGLTLSNDNYTLKQYKVSNGSLIHGIYISRIVESLFPNIEPTFDLSVFSKNNDNNNNNLQCPIVPNDGNNNDGGVIVPKQVTCLCGGQMVLTTPHLCTANDFESNLTYEQLKHNGPVLRKIVKVSGTSPHKMIKKSNGNNRLISPMGNDLKQPSLPPQLSVNSTISNVSSNISNFSGNINNIHNINQKNLEKSEKKDDNNTLKCWMYRCQKPILRPNDIIFYCKNHTRALSDLEDNHGQNGGNVVNDKSKTSGTGQDSSGNERNQNNNENEVKQGVEDNNNNNNNVDGDEDNELKNSDTERLFGVSLCLECSKMIFCLESLDLTKYANLRLVNLHINIMINQFLIHSKINSLMMSFLTNIVQNTENNNNNNSNSNLNEFSNEFSPRSPNYSDGSTTKKLDATKLKKRARAIKQEYVQLLRILTKLMNNGSKLFLTYIQTICKNPWLKRIVKTIMTNENLFKYFIYRMSVMFNVKINLQIITQLVFNRTFILVPKDNNNINNNGEEINQCQSVNISTGKRCDVRFSWYIGKYHCRACGKIVCSNHFDTFGISKLDAGSTKREDIFEIDLCDSCQLFDYWFYCDNSKQKALDDIVQQIKKKRVEKDREGINEVNEKNVEQKMQQTIGQNGVENEINEIDGKENIDDDSGGNNVNVVRDEDKKEDLEFINSISG